MSRNTERERALLYRNTPQPSTRIEDGLTYGDHGSHEIVADSDESERIKRGIIDAQGETTNWKNGITYGDPRDNAAAAERERQRLGAANAHLQRENFDKAELAMRREADFMEEALAAIGDAVMYGFADGEANGRAVGYWQNMTREQRASIVASGDVDEEVADLIHTQLWPAFAQAQVAHNAESTRVSGQMQKGIALNRIREEHGNPDDAAWNAHAAAVFARARAAGHDLADERMGAQDFETQFRAAEVALREDVRADAEAQFKVDVLNAPSTNISDGLQVLGPMGYMPVVPGGPIESKPDYAKAAARLGGEGDPYYDTPDDIRRGITQAHAPSETAEWRQVQDAAGEMFSEAEKARIAEKLGGTL
jgi:hypothetical protein